METRVLTIERMERMTRKEYVEKETRRYAETLSDPELYRAGKKVYDKMREYATGGLSFGMDWPTMYACHPHLIVAYRVLYNEYSKRQTHA